MGTINDKIKDFGHFFYQSILTLLIILIIGFVLYNRINHLFSINNTPIAQSEATIAKISSSGSENKQSISITLPTGASPQDVAKIFKQSKLIEDETKFIELLTNAFPNSDYKTGDMSFNIGISEPDIINLLKQK